MDYTNGEWYLDTNDSDDATRDYDVFAWTKGETNQYPTHIAEVNHCTPEVAANAHLIAAAPDMYEALKEAEEAMDRINGKYGNEKEFCLFCHANYADGVGIRHYDYCSIEKMRSTLAKVEGK